MALAEFLTDLISGSGRPAPAPQGGMAAALGGSKGRPMRGPDPTTTPTLANMMTSPVEPPGFLERIGNNFVRNIEDAPPEAWIGLGQMLAGSRNLGEGVTGGIGAFMQATQAARKKAGMAEALERMSGSFTPDQRAFLSLLGPEQTAGILGKNLFPEKPSEKWEQIDTNNDGVPDRQRNAMTGKVDDIPLSLADRKSLAAAGASRTSVNVLPAELGSRIGLGEGFLKKYDTLVTDLDKLNTPQGRGQLLFNTGEGGRIKRDVMSGVDALVRQLTGAGKTLEEAQSYASRYEPSVLDTAFDIKSKLKGLRYDLEHAAEGALRGRGGFKSPAGQSDTTIRYDATGARIK